MRADLTGSGVITRRKDTTYRITSKKEWGKFSCKPKLEIDIFLIYNNLKHLKV